MFRYNCNTETCRSCFNVNSNVNFNTVFKTTHWCISWWINETVIISRCCTVRMWNKTTTLVLLWCYSPSLSVVSSFARFLDHTQRHTTVARTSMDEWSARRRNLYLTAHHTHERYSCPPVEFEPTIPAGQRSQTHGLDRPAARPLGPATQQFVEECNEVFLYKVLCYSDFTLSN